jgi:4-hydroxy-tetrahydrodipicolinate synthase
VLTGPNVALPTPFQAGDLDETGLRTLINRNLEAGARGLLVLGSTGEAPTMTDEEQRRVIEITVETVAKRVPVVVGCGTNSTKKTIFYAEQATAHGADAVLAVAPYYNKPTQEGLYQHYKALSDAVDIPIFLYNHPGRCVVDISVETVIRLAKLRNIIGLKDSNPDLTRTLRLRNALGQDFVLVSGDEATGLGYMASGGTTIYTTIFNLVPGQMSAVHEAIDAGDYAAAFDAFKELAPLLSAMYCEPNPVPLKYALSLLGVCGPEVRLPLVGLAENSKQIVRAALERIGAHAGEATRQLQPA